MKKIFISFWVVLFLLGSLVSNAQKINSSYEVATWLGFRDAAVSYTFDDGCANQFAKAIPLFDEFDYKLTLFTVINWSTSNWEKLQSAAQNGHEVASHTVTHPNLSTSTKENQLIELKNSRDEINKRISGSNCVTIAYPFCKAGDYSICRSNYISARGCQGLIEGPTPKDFMNISSIICGTEGNRQTAADLNNTVENIMAIKGWGIFLFHGIDNDGGYSSFSSAELRKNLEYVKNIDSKVWVATFANATKYAIERNALNIKELTVKKNYIILSVKDTLDNAVFNQPISIRRTLPTGWSGAEVKQSSKNVAFKLIELGASKKVEFDVVPDAGDVKIIKR